MPKRGSLSSWILLVMVTAVAGWVTYHLGGWMVRLAAAGRPALLWLLAGAYAALAMGFLFTALLTRLAPARRYTVAVGLVFVMVAVAGWLIFDFSSETGPVPASLLGISLVVGAFGYALRVRGFSGRFSGRDS
jgi:hypothetical protein